jgi:hypothetical protein
MRLMDELGFDPVDAGGLDELVQSTMVRMKQAFLAALVILAAMASHCYGQSSASQTDKQVARLIEKMTTEKTEQQAFADLEALGCAAVPATIERMDDYRKLPDPRISLRNKSPDAFEGLRHYGPEKVVDALAAILNQITGQDFGFIYKGATDAERWQTVKGWREFLKKTPRAQLCAAG